VHFNKVLHNATTDRLTGAYNRQQFIRLAEVEFNRSQRYRHSLAIIVIHVDYARPGKANYSQTVASQIIQSAARRCLESIRGIDLFGRYNDDILIVLLPETGSEAARLVAQRLKERLTTAKVFTNRGPITTIAKVNVVTNQDENFKEFEQMMDHALDLLLPMRDAKEPTVIRDPLIK